MNYLIKHYKPILTTLLIAVVVFGLGGTVWAQNASDVACGAEQALEKTWDLTVIASLLIHLMAWAWSIPAVLAGELMSNDLVYGQIVWLEHYFYQFWTLMRTIANFALVAIIIMVIGKIMTNGGKAGEVLNKYGVRLLVAGIFINFSRFLMWALVDVSTVLIAGVGQIGNQAMEKVVNPDGKSWWRINTLTYSIPDKIEVDKCWCLTATSTGSMATSKTWNAIVSKRNSISGPLIVLGAGVMKFHAYSMDITCKSGTLGDFGKLTLKAVIQIFLMIMFIVPLLVLVAFNFFRLIYLRWRIICSPLIVLINLFDEVGDVVWKDIKQAVSPGTMINWLLQPVFTVGALIIGMMLVMWMYHALDFTQTETIDQIKVEWVTNKLWSSQMAIGENGNLGSVTLIDKIIEDPTATLGGWFGYLLVSFATCFVLWMLVKLSFSMSKNGIWSVMWDLEPTKLMETMRGEFMKRVRLPDVWWPLGGASLKEAASLLDPTSKDNKIMKKIEDVGNGIKDSWEKNAFSRMKKSWFGKMIGMDSEADFDKDSFKFTTVKNDADLAQRHLDTANLFDSAKKLVNDDSNSYKEFPIKTSTVAFDVVSKWYGSISWILDKSFDDEDYKKNEKWKKFGEIYWVNSYAAWLFNHLKSWKKITLSDWKIKESKDIKRARFSEAQLK